MEKQEQAKGGRLIMTGLLTLSLGCAYMVLSILTSILCFNYIPRQEDWECLTVEFMSTLYVLWIGAVIASAVMGWNLAFSAKSISMSAGKLKKYASVNGHLIIIRVVYTLTQYPNVSCEGQVRFWIALGDTLFHVIFLAGLYFIAFRARNEKAAAAALAAAVQINNNLGKDLP